MSLQPLSSGPHASGNFRSFARTVLALLALLFLAWPGSAAAQGLRIGVVASQTGAAAAAGAQQLAAVRSFERQLRSSISPEFRAVSFVIRDDASDARRALQLAQELVTDEEVHALICCTTGAAAAQVAPFAEAQRVLTISPAQPARLLPVQQMLLVLPADTLTQMRAAALDVRRFGQRVALLTLDSAFGTEAAEALNAGALEAGLHLTRSEVFPTGRRPLTPEALLVAASQPDAVVVWAPGADGTAAVKALRERGYTGPVYLDYTQLDSIRSAPPSGELRFMVPPAAVTGPFDPDDANYAALAEYRRNSGSTLLHSDASVDGALMFDAVQLILKAFEQALAYQVDPAATKQFRQALWDGLIGSGRADLAAGSYRFDGRNPQISIASGLSGVTLQAGRLVRHAE
jgi:branched-chain amino acid transport system substrate-binding protein